MSEEKTRSTKGSSVVPVQDQGANLDEVFERALKSAVRWAYGVVAGEVWVVSGQSLVNVKGGFFIDPVMKNSQPSDAMDRLTDQSRPDYLESETLAFGQGLAGALITEFGYSQSGYGRSMKAATGGSTDTSLAYRDIRVMADDPDQPYNARLKALREAGFGFVVGVLFEIRQKVGIVVFLARTTTSLNKLQSSSNENFMKHSADLLGGIVALKIPLRRVSIERNAQRQELLKRVRNKMRMLHLLAEMDPDTDSDDDSPPPFWLQQKIFIIDTYLAKRFKSWYGKVGGQDIVPGPGTPSARAPSMLFGSFAQMMILSYVSLYIFNVTDENFKFRIGTLAAMTCLNFSLTSAPPGQPKTGLLGTALVMLVVMSAKLLIPADVIPQYIIVAMVASVSITLMALFAVPHPPAAGTAVAFMGGVKLDWDEFAFLFVGYICCIISATLLVNLQETRQYPQYWAFDTLIPPRKKK